MLKKFKDPLISLVIPVYNAGEFIEKAINSVMKTDYRNFEVIVVDDISTDDSWNIIKEMAKKYNRIRIVRNEIKLLAAGTRNVGCRISKGEYIALLDHDVEVDKNWLKEALKLFKQNNKIGTVQGVVLDIKRRNIIQHAGIMINAYLGWVIAKGFGKSIDVYKLKNEEVFADATGLIFRKKVWEDIGGFDEDLAINLDDWDFNWRVWLYGYKQVLAPESRTYHWSKKQGIRDYWIKRVSWEFHFAKIPWLFIKNYELKNIIIHLPVFLSVNFLRGIFNLIFRLNPAPIIAFIQANFWVVSKLGVLLEKRREVQLVRKVDDIYLFKNLMDNSFVPKYFLLHWLPIIKKGRDMSIDKPYHDS